VVRGATLLQGTLGVRGAMSGAQLTVMHGASYFRGSVAIGTATAPEAGVKLEVPGTISGADLFSYRAAGTPCANIAYGTGSTFVKTGSGRMSFDVPPTMSGYNLVFAEATVSVIAPGFRDEQRELYLGLFRTMLVTQVGFAASLTLGQVLLAEQRYFWYGVAPLLYNLGIIVGTLLFAPSLGIYGPAIGAVLGAAIHLGSRFIGLRGSAFRPGLGWSARRDALREFVRLVLPKAVSQPVEPITFGFFTAIASSMAAGGITAFSFARNFQSLPVSLVGVAFAVAVFPALARAHAEGDRRAFRRLVALNAGRIGVFTLLAAVVMAVFGELGIGILLGGGSFDAADVALTGSLLAAFAISVPFESLSHLLSRAIYATRHTVLQVVASIAGLVITVVATLTLVDGLGIVGLPLGFGVGQAAKAVLLTLALGVRMRAWRGAVTGSGASSA